MGNGTKGGMCEDMIDADYNSAMDGDWKTLLGRWVTLALS